MSNDSSETVYVIDYGVGNLGSVVNMLKKVGAKNVVLTNDVEKIAKAKKLLLPGVGSFDHGMKRLEDCGVAEILRSKTFNDDVSLLGICLGMQLLTDGSEEGSMPGLGLVRGCARIFKDNKSLKVPHMGWNVIKPRKDSYVLKNLPNESRFYFVHSYYVSCENNSDVLSTTDYGVEFVSALQSKNIIGCQFHPEKSHRFGMQLFKNFVNS